MKKTVLFTIALIVCVLLTPVIPRLPLIFQTPEEALADFYDTTDQAEDMLMDPLILVGEKVVPLILREVISPEMKLRKYAIHFLGNGRYLNSLAVLQAILENEKEIVYIRGDALASIFNIEPKLGISLAKPYTKRDDYLGRQAAQIAKGRNNLWYQRSFWQALQNVHH